MNEGSLVRCEKGERGQEETENDEKKKRKNARQTESRYDGKKMS